MSRAEVPLVRAMSWWQIERIATALLEKYYPDCLNRPQAVPVSDFLEFVLPEDFGVDVRFRPLPPSTEAVMQPIGERNRPEVLMSPETYEALLSDDGRARYTAAHEAFHGFHHSKELRSELVHGRFSGLYRRQEIPPFRNPERQADVFAARFLMPEAMVRQVWESSGGRLVTIVETFKVSNHAARIRIFDELKLNVPASSK